MRIDSIRRTRRAKFDVATKQVSNTEGIAVMKRFEERLELLGKQREKDEETHKKEISSQNAHIRQLISDIKGLMNEVETLQYFRSDVVRIRQTILDAESHPKINTPKEADPPCPLGDS